MACLAAPPGAVGARGLSALWGPYEAGWSPYKEELLTSMPGGLRLLADIDAWRLEASMPGWPGWLAWLAGWLGWLAWLAGLAWLDGRNAEILTRSTL